MKSFRDPVTGVLRAWGYAASNGDDTARDEPDDFNLEPGKWRLEGGEWVVVAPDPRIAILRQIEEIEQATMVPRITREFMLLAAQDLAQREAERRTAAGVPTTAEELLAANIGYQRTLQVEAQIAALRAQL